VEYVPGTEQCCGSGKYTVASQFCSGNNVYNKCGGSEYTPVEEACCGNSKYTLSTQFCSGNPGSIYSKCGGNDYNPATEACCNNSKYTLATHFCLGNTVTPLCGGETFTSFQFCYNNSIENKCGGTVTFTPGTEQCCGSGKYALATHLCDARDSKTYKKVEIGTQTWMAENLDYDIPGNTTDVCNSNLPTNCAKYGRLYNWSTAMNNSASSIAVPSEVQGICPSGWHIPSNGEWDVLLSAVGSPAEVKLKATSGWIWCGPSGSGEPYLCEDSYGFSALPGGGVNSGGSFDDVGHSGGWWSTTEIDSIDACHLEIGNSDILFQNCDYKSNLHSVRCVKD
jgi:uncharacterized protein (TIGR02145 family)